MKGLVCAGGEATRLGELTRVTNKHLLPVGRWPMVYYPLQLLQLAGIREVLVVTGKGHAGQMIDLLGDGHLSVRGGDAPLLELDLTYKVQTRARRDRRGRRAWPRTSPAGEPLVVVLGDNIFEHSHAAEIAAWGASGGGRAGLRQGRPGPGELRRRRLRRRGGVIDLAEKAGVVDLRYSVATDERRGRRPLLLSAGRLRRDREPRALRVAASSRSPTSTGLRRARRALGRPACAAGGRTPASTGSTSPRSAARSTRRGQQVSVEGIVRIPLRRFEDERGWFCELRRESRPAEADGADERLVLAPGRDPRPALPRARPGRPLRLPAGDGARRRARPRRRARRSPRTSATRTRSRSTSRAATPTASRR